MAHRHTINRHTITGTSRTALPLDALAFTGLVAPLICYILITGLPVTAAAVLILGWCLMLSAQGLYSVFVLTGRFGARGADAEKPAHLAAVLEGECDDERHHRRLRMLASGLTPANASVMIAAAFLGLTTFGPLEGMAGIGFVYALAVHSYVRPVRYAIWCVSTLVLGYAGQLALSGAPAIADLSSQIAGSQIIAIGFGGLAATQAYRFTIITNLRHIAGIAFAYAGCGILLQAVTFQPAITNLVTLSALLFLPGLCAFSAKTDRQCRHRFYGYGY